MNKYRFLPTSTWSDDTFLNMSPEQKLIYLYLLSSPYTSLCGIFKISISTMGHFIGLRNGSIDSAFSAFLLKYSDWVQYDDQTGEVALLYWPKFALVNANIKAFKKAESDLQEVQSITLLKELIARNSSRLSEMYLKRLRQIQIERINQRKIDQKNGNYAQLIDNEVSNAQIEIEIEKEIENILSDSDRIEPLSPDSLNETGTGKPVESSAAAAPNSAPAAKDDFFSWFWDTYDNKTGKAKCKAKCNKLKKSDRDEIRRTLEWYVKDTVKDDSEQHGNVWRPRRKNPLTYLNGRAWEDYEGLNGPKIKNQPAAVQYPGSGYTQPAPTIPAGYGMNQRIDIKALPDK